MKAEDLRKGAAYWVYGSIGWVRGTVALWEPDDKTAPIHHLRVLIFVNAKWAGWFGLEDLFDDDAYAREVLTS